jgi:hypothetical protein
MNNGVVNRTSSNRLIRKSGSQKPDKILCRRLKGKVKIARKKGDKTNPSGSRKNVQR